MTPHEGIAFFDFLELFMLDLVPASKKIDRSLCKIQKIPPKVCASKRDLIYVYNMVYYLRGMSCLAFEMSFW
jgi:hypothetical protein